MFKLCACVWVLARIHEYSAWEARGGHQIPWSKRSTYPGCWEQNSLSLPEQYTLWTAKPSLQPYFFSSPASKRSHPGDFDFRKKSVSVTLLPYFWEALVGEVSLSYPIMRTQAPPTGLHDKTHSSWCCQGCFLTATVGTIRIFPEDQPKEEEEGEQGTDNQMRGQTALPR